MTDKPPPPTEKKPRRSAAPRKRSPAKRAAKAKAGSAVQHDDVPGNAASEVAEAGATASEAVSETANATRPAPSATGTESKSSATPDAGTAERRDAGPRRDTTRDDSPKPTEAREPAHDASRSAVSAPTPAAAAPMKQDDLRPGELIRVPLSVRWRDLDAFNHVNNSKDLSYLEEARLRWMLSVPGMGMDDNVAPVVAASNLNYRRPIEWPNDVVVELFVERLGGSSITIGHRIVDAKAPHALYCDGNVVMVWIDRTTGRSAPLPAGVRDACR